MDPNSPPKNHRFPDLVYAYIGNNNAHRDFRIALMNAKVLAFLLGKEDSAIIQDFLRHADDVRKHSPDGYYAFGIGGRSTTSSLQLGVHIRCNEVDLLHKVPGGFSATAYGLVYREANRAFETFVVDLFAEIARTDKRVLYSEQKLTHEAALSAASPEALVEVVLDKRKSELTRSGYLGFEKTYESLGLPLLGGAPLNDEQKDVRGRLIVMAAARNIMEHNSGIVNSEFIARVPEGSYALGQTFVVSPAELGDALSAVEFTADDLNRRAVEKFKL